MLTIASVTGGIAEFFGAVQDGDLVVVSQDAVADRPRRSRPIPTMPKA